jgi:hypothetical protein
MSDVVHNAPVVAAPENHSASEAQEVEQTVNVDEVEAAEASEAEAQAQPEQGQDEGQPDELDEIELEGKKYQIPKPLKSGFMMQADYTRKTQEVASQKQAIEQERQRLTALQQADHEETQGRAVLVAIDASINELNGTNWDQRMADDPIGAQQQFMRLTQLKEQRAQVEQALQQRQSVRTQAMQQDLLSRVQQTQEYAQKNIKGWSPETDKQIVEFARTKGVTEAELQSVISPKVYDILHLARIGEQTLAKQTAAPKLQAKVQPTKTVGGKSNPSAGKSLADMSMEEYAAHRTAQLAKAR